MIRPALTGLIAAAALAAGLSPPALASNEDVIRQLNDRAEIEALMWHYVHALDSLDAQAYAATYTPDGRFGSGPHASIGRDALRKIVADVKKRRAEQEAKGEKPAQMRHIITNEYLEFIDRDHARLNSYWLTVFEAADPKSLPRVAAAGRGVDELVRFNGQWLIKSRDVAVKN